MAISKKKVTNRKNREITEQETAEPALRDNEEGFREIFQQNEDALLLLQSSTGQVMDANSAAIALFGYTWQEFISGGLPLILMPREHEEFRRELCSSRTSGKFRIARIASKRNDGSTIIVSIWGKALQLIKSEVLFCSIRNITERLRLEEETRLLQAKLIQMNKMTALGMLVSGIAHEINNPNHFISVNAKVISDAWKDAANVLTEHYRKHGDFLLGGVPFSEMRYIVPRLLASLSEGSDRIKNIVDNLKDYSQQCRAALDSAVDVNKVITSAALLLSSQIAKCTDRFEIQEGKDLPPAKGNKQQLEQVVMNLIINALQSLQDRSARVIVSSWVETITNNIVIRVEDEGIGISQEVLKHITEPFYTTRIDEGGTGLGLSIAFSIVRDHQGSLTFQSEPGKGTAATISLPVYHNNTKRNRYATDQIP